VGALDEGFCVVPFPDARNTNADRASEYVSPKTQRIVRHYSARALCYSACRAQARPWQDHGESLLAESGDYVHLTHRGTKGMGHDPQHLVGRFATVFIVQLFELVHIHEKQRYRRSLTLPLGDPPAEFQIQSLPISQSR